VQYRGKLMPLVPMSGHGMPPNPGTRQAVLVFSDQHRAMGLMVDAILDVVEEHAGHRGQPRPAGLPGRHRHRRQGDGRDGLRLVAAPGGRRLVQAAADRARIPASVLLVEDSAFFRHLLVPSVTRRATTSRRSGYRPQALRLRDAGRDVRHHRLRHRHAGAGRVRPRPRGAGGRPWQHLPMIALSGRSEPGDVERGRNAGFTDYMLENRTGKRCSPACANACSQPAR
jgi:two-component system chemotaxis sensor kinase CheA